MSRCWLQEVPSGARPNMNPVRGEFTEEEKDFLKDESKKAVERVLQKIKEDNK